MTANDEYYRRRAEEELAAAETAPDAAVSQIHLELAKRYLEETEANPDAPEALAIRALETPDKSAHLVD